MTPRSVQLDSDCEGPLCLNDNAFEVCRRYIPDGDRFFSQVSRYDDYLADIVRKDGYEAGSTLRLVAPFLKAFGLTNDEMLAFSRRNIGMVRGAAEMFQEARSSSIEAFVVSTSYQQFAHAVAEELRIPFDRVYCTPFDLEAAPLPPDEIEELRDLARQAASLPPLELPDAADEPLSGEALGTIAFMDELFWQKLPRMRAQALIDSVRLVGAEGKARAIRDSLARTGNPIDRLLYVGDSITDVKAFDLVREGGGLTVAFNGNRYAVDAAEIACAADDAVATSIVVDVFVRRGKDGVFELAEAWPAEQDAQVRLLERMGVSPAVAARLRSLQTRGIGIYRITDESKERARTRSMEMRVLLRGEHIGALG
ncbi:MAG: hypothetical protein QME71_09195 [Dehalococcoidia bacterium]|nr:hypothetical protein [Dehalococcoidia bacterium]